MIAVGFSIEMSRPTVRSDSTNFSSAPMHMATMKFVEKLNAWNSGSTTSSESFSLIGTPKVSMAPSMSLMKLLWVSIAPLGLPVVPDV